MATCCTQYSSLIRLTFKMRPQTLSLSLHLRGSFLRCGFGAGLILVVPKSWGLHLAVGAVALLHTVLRTTPTGDPWASINTPNTASTYRTYMNSSTIFAMPAIDSIARNKQTAREVFGQNGALAQVVRG
jgi:hypothetical protein